MQTELKSSSLSLPRHELVVTPSSRNKVRPFSQNGKELAQFQEKTGNKMNIITETGAGNYAEDSTKPSNLNTSKRDDESVIKNPPTQVVAPITKPSPVIEIKKEELKKKLLREEHFFCLCKKFNAKAHACKICTNTLCGYPLHACTLFLVSFLGLISVFSYCLYVYLNFKYSNNSYFATCLSNIDCNTTAGLYCGTTAGVCNCPARNTVGRCDCNKGYYWNGTSCTLVLSYNSAGCVNDYNCDSTKRLACSNGVCTCTKPRVWSNTSCNYNYIGCYNDTLYQGTVGSPLWSSQNNNSRMTYAIETCVGYCYNIQYKFALISIGNYQLNCYCQNNFTNSSSGLCNIMCPGLETTGYQCGSSSYILPSIKAVYQAL